RFRPTSLFLFTAPPPTAIYTLSLHDALPIFSKPVPKNGLSTMLRTCFQMSVRPVRVEFLPRVPRRPPPESENSANEETANMTNTDRKSTRLNSSHVKISYAVFCLKKKKKNRK